MKNRVVIGLVSLLAVGSAEAASDPAPLLCSYTFHNPSSNKNTVTYIYAKLSTDGHSIMGDPSQIPVKQGMTAGPYQFHCNNIAITVKLTSTDCGSSSSVACSQAYGNPVGNVIADYPVNSFTPGPVPISTGAGLWVTSNQLQQS
ncbi:MAG: hypothetical protein NTU49_11365 [Gammaproteobacteria bacterium]|nr:hypothetical protein [Gammaproteobacteria bacterium]